MTHLSPDRSSTAAPGSRGVWRWWAVAATAVLLLSVLAFVAGRPSGDTAAGQAPQAEDTSQTLPEIDHVPGPVLEPGTPVAELEPGTASVDAAGQDFGALPSSEDLPPGLDPAQVAPDYIAVASADGSSIAGYVKATDMYPATGGIDGQGIPVYSADGLTVVGTFVPNTGFVPSE